MSLTTSDSHATQLADKNIGIIGAGAMGGSIARGLANALDNPQQIVVCDHSASKLQTLAQEAGVRIAASAEELVESGSATQDGAADSCPDVVVLAVKPQVLPALLGSVGNKLGEALVISIAAGVSLATLEAALPAGCRVVRAMPNLPIATGSGATAITGGSSARSADVELARELFATMGAAQVMREDQLDVEGAVVGCGPAFVALMVDALTRAAVLRGLPAAAARQMIEATMVGTARQLMDSDMHPRAYMERVTSPGGTTAAALVELEPQLQKGVCEAVDAALARTAELAAREFESSLCHFTSLYA